MSPFLSGSENSMAIHIQVGKQKRVAVVFSCPGRHEEIAGRPAAGTTGRNLDAILELLCKALNRSDLTRSNITITNAWPKVEYKAKTGRSEPTPKEARAPENIERLQEELEGITDFVIFCGEAARAVSQRLQLKLKPRMVYIRHIGLRGMSLINKDVQGERITAADAQISAGCSIGKAEIQAANTGKRLAVVVRSILAQLESEPADQRDGIL